MPDNPETVDAVWTWGSILKLAFTTGLFTGAFNQGFAWMKEVVHRRSNDRRAGRAMALHLVEMLTSYAQECHARIGYNRYDSDMGDYGRYSDVPDLPLYPVGSEWEVLPPRIAVGLRDLRNEVKEANRRISITAEVNDPSDASDQATHECVSVGYMALNISDRLRKHYELGPYQAAGRSEFASDLRRRYRQSNHGPFRKLWHSLTVWRIRWRIWKGYRRLLRALGIN